MMSEAKALGTMYQKGWRPRRTIVYASWDGEEAGLLGSTEWAETHARELRNKAVLYLNSDTNARGFLRVGGSSPLQHVVNRVAETVTDPETDVSVNERLRAHILVRNSGRVYGPRTKAAATDSDVPIRALGSGSDYSTFVHRLGIPSLSVGFHGESHNYGVYHSRYDSFDHFVRYGDPTFEYEVALAKVAGRIVMRFANAKLLPMHFDDAGQTFERYVKDLHAHMKRLRANVVRQKRLFAIDAYVLTDDPLDPIAPPSRLTHVPKLDFAPLDTAVNKLVLSAHAYERAYQAVAATGFDMPMDDVRDVNQLLGAIGQQLLQRKFGTTQPLGKNLIMSSGGGR